MVSGTYPRRLSGLGRASLVWTGVETRDIVEFLAIAFGAGWVLMMLALGSGTRPSMPLLAAAMWAPGLAAILIARYPAHRERVSLHLRHLGWPDAYLWALLLPPGLALAGGLLALAAGAARLDPGAVFIHTAAAGAIDPSDAPRGIVGQILTAMTFAPLFNLLVMFGSELGWRGYLLPQLLSLGRLRAILLTGGLWWLWQVPTVLRQPSSTGLPLFDLGGLLVYSLLVGAVLSWLYLRTGSPWAPALVSASLGAATDLPMLFLTDVNPMIGGAAGPAAWLPLAAVVAWLVWRRQFGVDGLAAR